MKLARKQQGFVLTTELIILATIMTIGSIIGFSIMRDAVVAELLDVANAIETKQQYAFDGAKKSSTMMSNRSEDLIWISPSVEDGAVVFDNPRPLINTQ